MGDDRGPRQADTLDEDGLSDPDARELLVPNDLLDGPEAAAPVLLRPDDRSPAVLEERALPLPGLNHHRLLVDSPVSVARQVVGRVCFEECARLGSEGRLVG
jgi:hypothetical protein